VPCGPRARVPSQVGRPGDHVRRVPGVGRSAVVGGAGRRACSVIPPRRHLSYFEAVIGLGEELIGLVGGGGPAGEVGIPAGKLSRSLWPLRRPRVCAHLRFSRVIILQGDYIVRDYNRSNGNRVLKVRRSGEVPNYRAGVFSINDYIYVRYNGGDVRFSRISEGSPPPKRSREKKTGWPV